MSAFAIPAAASLRRRLDMCTSTRRTLPSQSVCHTSRSNVSLEDPARLARQHGQQVELGAGDGDRLGDHPHLAGLAVDLEVPDALQLVRLWFR